MATSYIKLPKETHIHPGNQTFLNRRVTCYICWNPVLELLLSLRWIQYELNFHSQQTHSFFGTVLWKKHYLTRFYFEDNSQEVLLVLGLFDTSLSLSFSISVPWTSLYQTTVPRVPVSSRQPRAQEAFKVFREEQRREASPSSSPPPCTHSGSRFRCFGLCRATPVLSAEKVGTN